jgi:tetratricopeptide (TPR) repeat protein
MKKHLLCLLFIFCFCLIVCPAFSQTFNELIKRYREAQKSEDYDRMVLILDTVLAKYPNNEPEITYYNRGNTYRHLKEYKKSILDYTKTLEIKSDYASAYINRGVSYHDEGEYENALKDYNEAIKLKPDYPMVYYNRANTYSILFDYDRAIADYSKTIDLKPDFAEAYYIRGDKYFGINFYKEAIQDWEKAIKLEPAYESELRNKINEAKYQLDKKK